MDITLIAAIITGVIGAISALAGFYLKYWLDRKSEQEKRNFELKSRIYIDLLRTLLIDFFADNDQAKMRDELHKILSEAYIVAPDFVIEKLRKIFVDGTQETGKIKLADCTDLVMSLRKDLLKDTTLSSKDHFFLSLDKK